MDHPEPPRLTAFAADLLDAGEAREIDVHLVACAECARKAAQARSDFARITAALDAPVPSGLEARTAQLLARPRRVVPWIAVAAALLIGLLGLMVAGLTARVAALERALAGTPSPPPAAADATALADFLKQACATQIDQRALELADAARLSDADAEGVRASLARAVEDGTRQLGRYLAGEATAEELAGRDLLAALDRELGGALPAVGPELERRQAQAVASLVQSTSEEICREVGASEAQGDRIRTALMRAAADRRDLALLPAPLPELIKRIELSSDRGWKRVIAQELDAAQTARLETYVRNQKAAAEADRAWFCDKIRRS